MKLRSILLLLQCLLMQLTRSLVSKSNRLVRRISGLNMSTNQPSQLSVHVKGSLTAGSGESFHLETLENARNSILEKGISRFDYLKRIDSETDDFLLIEVYRDDAAPAAHKETSHYNRWRESVADSMAVPRAATKFRTLFPSYDHWLTSPSASKSTRVPMCLRGVLW